MQKELLSQDARLLEAILFIENEPLSVAALSRLATMEEETCLAALKEIQAYWSTHMHGLELLEQHGSYGFAPAADLHQRLRACYGKKVDRRLTKAALETLSIIAYSQPITRREVENIRGVNSDSIVRVLREREYIKVIGKKDVIGYPSLYGTTKKFLLDFNLKSISALPRLSDIDEQRFIEQEELFDEH